jgi:CO dehydrogenase nickel-insertion accessory protein CooC1
MQTITFYSYKGGTGRTLVLANVARYLSRFGQAVVVLDFDLEAPGLHYKLQFEEPGETLTIQRGVVDYFHACATVGVAPQTLREFFVPITLSPTEKGPIHLMAAGNVPSEEYWRKLS